MNKHSTFGLALSLLVTDIMVMILNLLLIGNLFGLVKSPLYDWAITIIFTLMLYMLVWMRASQRGKSDIDFDCLNQKRLDNNEISGFKKVYLPYKGFVAGLICKIPAVVLLILKLATGNQIYEFLMNVYFGVHYSASVITFGTGIVPTLIYILLFSAVSGAAYMTGPVQREKIMTVIKRNEGSYKSQKYEDYKADRK